MAHVFLSYSHQDEGYVAKLARSLCDRGIDTWMDSEIEYGDQYPAVIEQHLDDCSAVVVVMSEHSRRSEWVANELTYAKAKGKNVLPLLLSGGPWLQLATTQHADVTDGNLPPADFYERLRVEMDGTPQGGTQRRPKQPQPKAAPRERPRIADRVTEAAAPRAGLPHPLLRPSVPEFDDKAVFSNLPSRMELDRVVEREVGELSRGTKLGSGTFKVEVSAPGNPTVTIYGHYRHRAIVESAGVTSESVNRALKANGWRRERQHGRTVWAYPGKTLMTRLGSMETANASEVSQAVLIFFCEILSVSPENVSVRRVHTQSLLTGEQS
ncbi:MAG: toll/interleukin-1 receptor domain-containing protein [Ilumatobacter sp.]|uniref:toll/interleukin-1 receptor domain-containing protein n=1 Tax=Ilumatobacter sp. TaxID=1967498 RepID=UPI00261F06C4|nr:toll/interleukin-1 receptor domain-containing protein [Ilumatobacter sp.]MDJ0771422.1 toll/interleukin-1 receptor domain-containing protein [Ilumatobacter sp.]